MEEPEIEITELNRAYWASLEEGVLKVQSCLDCSHQWLPAREECPSCLSDRWEWRATSGNGRVISWVIYHVAYHEAYKSRVPYNVAIVELEEGPRLITTITGIANEELAAEQRVKLAPERRGNVVVPAFAPA